MTIDLFVARLVEALDVLLEQLLDELPTSRHIGFLDGAQLDSLVVPRFRPFGVWPALA